jgi:ABC-type transport system involved in cytochrome c biogenesis permease component
MTFLPIVARELRIAARKRNTYLGRIVAALVASLVVGWEMMTMGRMPYMRPSLGPMLFGTLSMFAFVYCLLSGVRATADCISEEKREGTLGLLFLTDLKGYDVVFGKLAATSLNTFYHLLAIFPVMAIPVLLGGVSGQMLYRTIALLLNTLFFSLAAGMFVSAISRGERRAMGAAILLVLFVTGGMPLLGVWWNSAFNLQGEPPLLFLIASPGFAFSKVDGTDGLFWISLATMHGLAWACLAGASALLPRTWLEKAATPRRAQLEQKAAAFAFGDAGNQSHVRRALLDRNPILWLAARNRMDALLLWGFIAASGLIWLWGAWRWPKDWFSEFVYVATAVLVQSVLKFWLAGHACRQFAEDRQTGALELLLATPLTVREIVHGQLLALRRVFAGPILVVVAAQIAFALACILKPDTQTWRERDAWLWLWWFIGCAGTLLADAYTIGWLGLWYGVTSRQANRASGAVIWRVIFLPAVVMWMGGALFGVYAVFGRAVFGMGTVLILWFAIGLTNDLVWAEFARNRLTNRLREVATQRFDAPQPGWFAKILRKKSAEKPPVVVG